MHPSPVQYTVPKRTEALHDKAYCLLFAEQSNQMPSDENEEKDIQSRGFIRPVNFRRRHLFFLRFLCGQRRHRSITRKEIRATVQKPLLCPLTTLLSLDQVFLSFCPPRSWKRPGSAVSRSERFIYKLHINSVVLRHSDCRALCNEPLIQPDGI